MAEDSSNPEALAAKQDNHLSQNRQILRAARRWTNKENDPNQVLDSKTTTGKEADEDSNDGGLPKCNFTFGANFKTLKDLPESMDENKKKKFSFSFAS